MAGFPSQLAWEILSPALQARITGGPPCSPVIYVNSGDLTPSPHALGVNALSTESCPKPLKRILLLVSNKWI